MNSINTNDMYSDNDLREYVNILIKYWRWLLIFPLVISIAMFAFQTTQPSIYQSSVLLAITNPLDTNIAIDGDIHAYGQLALSDALVTTLHSRFADQLPEEIENSIQLRNNVLSLDTSTSSDLLGLTVTTSSPQLAADIANSWAQILIENARPIYGTPRVESIGYLELQLEENEILLKNAENAIIEFESSNNKVFLENELNTLIQQQIDTLDTLSNVERLSNNISAFRQYILSGDPNESVTAQDLLTIIDLQNQVFESISAQYQISVNFDFDGELTIASELAQNLDTWLSILSDRRDRLNSLLEETNPQILNIQTDLRILDNQSQRFEAELQQIQETRNSLQLSLNQQIISSQSIENQVRVVAEAISVNQAVPNNTLSTVVFTFMVTFILLATGVVSFYWLQNE